MFDHLEVCEVCKQPDGKSGDMAIFTRCTENHMHVLCLICTRALIYQHAPRVVKCHHNLSDADEVLLALRRPGS